MNLRKLRVNLNAPVVLGFTGICLLAMLLDALTGGASTDALFSVYRSSLLSPLTWLRFFGHVFGHMGWQHLINNLMYILILGPMIEEKYGPRNTMLLMAATALVTGLVNFIFFPHIQMMGASGIVFAMILLSSITGFQEGSIPLTFILVAVLYIGQQLGQALFVRDDVAQMAHIVGGLTGAALGFELNRRKGSAGRANQSF